MANEVSTRPIDTVKLALQQVPFEQSLPANISPDKFRNAVLTAINMNPDLLDADKGTLLTSCMKAAADGLLPDGREAALVVYSTKVKRAGQDVWIKAVQYMPMAYGIIKRLRNSGEIASISVQVVYENDEFDYVLGDDERILHRPARTGPTGELIGSYAIVKFKDGTEPQREFMPRRDIDKARSMSKSKDGPAWTNWFDQMAKKCVLHRISKYLPMSAEDASFVRRQIEDDVVDMEVAPPVASLPPPAPTSKLDKFETDAPAPAKSTRKKAEPVKDTINEESGDPSPTAAPEAPNMVDDTPPLDSTPHTRTSIIAMLQACQRRGLLTKTWRSVAVQGYMIAANDEDKKAVSKVYGDMFRSLPEEQAVETV